MLFKKQMSFSNGTTYKNSGELLSINNNSLVNGMKKLNIKSKDIRYNLKDISGQKTFNPDYEIFEYVVEFTMQDSVYEEYFTHIKHNDYLFSIINRTQNFKERTTVIHAGYQGLYKEILDVE